MDIGNSKNYLGMMTRIYKTATWPKSHGFRGVEVYLWNNQTMIPALPLSRSSPRTYINYYIWLWYSTYIHTISLLILKPTKPTHGRLKQIRPKTANYRKVKLNNISIEFLRFACKGLPSCLKKKRLLEKAKSWRIWITSSGMVPMNLFSKSNYLFWWIIWSCKYIFWIMNNQYLFGLTWPIIRLILAGKLQWMVPV